MRIKCIQHNFQELQMKLQVHKLVILTAIILIQSDDNTIKCNRCRCIINLYIHWQCTHTNKI